MISIYTRTNRIFSKERIKWEIKRLLNKKDGPQMVLESLTDGLKEINEPFVVNPKKPLGTVHVISGIESLKDAIQWKKNNIMAKLVAGPNVVTLPEEHNEIIASKEIDWILQPSKWVKDFYISKLPELEDKIKVWPAGSSLPTENSTRENFCIIYHKNYRNRDIQKITNILKEKNINFEILEYGKFKQKDYFELLKKASFVIYMSKSESQGLALQEAWIRNVPTLVLISEEFNNGKDSWLDSKINAPYLEDDFGYLFEIENLADKIDKTKKLNPKEKASENFSNEACAQKYLDLIK